MNEELKIIIRAITTEAKKNLETVRKEFDNIQKSGNESGKTIDTAMKSMGKSVAIAIGSITALTTALVALGKSSMEFRKTQAQLNAGFQSMGLSAGQAASTYGELYSFLGERDTAVEAANQLAQLTQNEQDLAEWTNILMGVYAKFPSSLPVESLAEAANETAKTGKVVGALADALNWAGASEEAFQAQLESMNSVAEREAYIRSTLNAIYSGSASLYKQNNKALIEYNKSQVELDNALAEATKYVVPLMTSLNSLGATMLAYLSPAIHTVSIYLTAFIQLIGEAIEWTATFFGLISGGDTDKDDTKTNMAGYQEAMEKYLDDVQAYYDRAANGADEYGKSVEKLKKQAMGFDELNIVNDPSKAASAIGHQKPTYEDGTEIKPPDPGDYGLGAADMAKRQDELNKKLAEAKAVLKPILITLGAIAGLVKTIQGGFAIREFLEGFNAKPAAEGTEAIQKFMAKLTKLQFLGFKLKEIFTVIGGKFEAVKVAITTAAKAVSTFFGSIGVGTIIAIVAAVIALASAVYYLWKNWDSVVQAVKDFFAENIAPKFEKIKSLFVDLWEAIKSIGDAFTNVGKLIWDALPPGLQKQLTNIGLCIKVIAEAIGIWFKNVDWLKEIGKVFEWLGGLVVAILSGPMKVAFSTFARFLQGLVELITGIVQIISGIISGFINLIVGLFTGDFSKALDSVKMICEGIKNVFFGAVNVVLGWAYEFVMGVIRWFQKMWDVLVGHSIVPDMVKAIIDWFMKLPKQLFSMISNFVNTIINFFKNLATSAGTVFSNMVANIKKPFANIATWFKDTFTKAWNNVKNVFSAGGKIFDGIKGGISGVFTTVVNGLIGGINKVIAIPFNNINSILNGIRNIDIAGIKPFSGLWGHNPLSVPQIPKLATGGIVDGATLAMIGERGREAVLPLENNTGWMDALAERIAARNNTPSKIVLKVGEKELGWATINSINGITQQTGNLQLVMP